MEFIIFFQMLLDRNNLGGPTPPPMSLGQAGPIPPPLGAYPMPFRGMPPPPYVSSKIWTSVTSTDDHLFVS